MSGRRRIIAIVNRAAGAAEKQGGEAARSAILAAFAEAELDVELTMPEGAEIAGHAASALERCNRGEFDAVAVGGGDGTIRTVAHVLAGTGVPLAILPLGTLNHFAKDLGVPFDLAGAVKVLAAFHQRPVDVGEVNGELFINNSSIGIYPYMVADRERRRTDHGLGKWLAMAYAVLRTFRRFPRRRLVVDADGTVTSRRTPLVFVANNEYDLNFLSLGRKQLDAGRLYVYVAKPRTSLAFLWFVVRAGLGFANRASDLDLIEVGEATIHTRTSRLPVALDGEVQTMAGPLRYRTRPGALQVVVPAPA